MRAFVVVGLGFGDESKGATVDFLAHQHSAGLVVRYNGGAQAAHHVVTPDGRMHCFSQFGAGTFSGARTHLSQYVRVHPQMLQQEAKHLVQLGESNILDRITIDPNCLITTPFHEKYSQEIARTHKRGTCGIGVGETLRYAEKSPLGAIYASDLSHPKVLRAKLEIMSKHYKRTWDLTPLITYYRWFADNVNIAPMPTLTAHDTVILEGAQGVLLDTEFGFKPYVTSSITTTENAQKLLREHGYPGTVETVGCLRMYATRHGVGPFPTEDATLNNLPERHNTPNEYQGTMRRGWFDLELTQHAIDINGGVSWIAMSHLDYWNMRSHWKATFREYMNREAYIDYIAARLNTFIKMRGYGMTRKDRIYDNH